MFGCKLIYVRACTARFEVSIDYMQIISCVIEFLGFDDRRTFEPACNNCVTKCRDVGTVSGSQFIHVDAAL